MSFAVDAKREVLKSQIKNDCCSLAFLSALIKGSGQLTLTKGKHQINIYTEIEDLFDVVWKESDIEAIVKHGTYIVNGEVEYTAS